MPRSLFCHTWWGASVPERSAACLWWGGFQGVGMDPLADGDPRKVGGYQLLGRLGKGGMGTVFLGRAVSGDGSLAAVKIIRAEFAKEPNYLRRFKREAESARAVSSPYTARVIDAGVDDRPPWLATEFIAGPSLHDVLATGPLPMSAVW